MNRKIIPTLILAASLLFTACASPAAGSASTTAKVGTTAIETTKTESKGPITAKEFETYKSEKEAEITTLEKELDVLKKDAGKTPDNSALAFKQRPAGMLYFPLITLKSDGKTPYNAGYVAIEPQASVADKLDKLTAGISKLLFNGSKLKVIDIKAENGKKIVYIDLVDADNWIPRFQGSTGGGINSQALVLSYLQKDFKNSWIDGVHFTLDGQPIELDHAPILEETQFRKN